MKGVGFPVVLPESDILCDRSIEPVAGCIAYKAIEFGMLNLVEESHLLLAVLATKQSEKDSRTNPRYHTIFLV